MSFRRKTVLISDDHPTFAMYLSILLNRMGFDVVPVENSKEAVILLGIMNPDIVMLSLKSPDMDGMTALRHIKEDQRTSSIPVIMISDHQDPEAHKECQRLGCSGFLAKPVELSELNDILWNVLVLPGGRRRKSLRVSYEKRVAITHKGVAQNYYAVSLSEGGIYVRKRNRLPIGTPVQIALPLKDHQVLNIRGVVIDEKGLYGNLFKVAPGITIDFKEMNRHDFERLRAYIAELLVGDILEEQEEPLITINLYKSRSFRLHEVSNPAYKV